MVTVIRFGISKIVFLLILLLLTSCRDSTQLEEFTTDGCSLFPESLWMSDGGLCSCCFEHDSAYWQGGSESKRYGADLKLQDCVLAKTGSEMLARVMFEGVHVGGSPYLYTWFRWGYGWEYGRGYKPLSENEQTEVDCKFKDFVEQENNPVCGN